VTSHSMQNINKWWQRGQDMPVAVWIGHHPAAIAGGQSRLGYPESHLPAMGGVMGEPLRLVPSEKQGGSSGLRSECGWAPRRRPCQNYSSMHRRHRRGLMETSSRIRSEAGALGILDALART